MKIGVIGCGYVFDHYMATRDRHPGMEFAGVFDTDRARADRVGHAYELHVYDSAEALLADPAVTIVANFTPIPAHYAVSRAALEAGKHVYSEKPLTASLPEAQDLIRRAEDKGLRLSCAPSNALSPTIQTLWSLVDQDVIGTVRLVYAEFDDNPVYLLAPETWRSRTGAPWPYLHEYEMGCTWEHAGYHLSWMCALFGPVRSVTAFSKVTLPDKTDRPLDPPGTPDFSAALLDFHSGVTGRLTFSIAGPVDHRMRIIGNRSEASADTYRHYEAPVRVEPFVPLSLKARNAASLRRHSVLQWLFGIGGRQVPLAPQPVPGVRPPGGNWRDRLKRREFGQQDKCLGIAELTDAIATDRPHFPPHDFTLHLTELTLAIQAAGPDGAAQTLSTRFDPLSLPEATRRSAPDYDRYTRPGAVPRALASLLGRSGVRRG
jgi:predicted dehydrogenase